MQVTKMISDLETERAAIDEVLAALRRLAENSGQKRRGRPPKWMSETVTSRRRGRPKGSKNKPKTGKAGKAGKAEK